MAAFGVKCLDFCNFQLVQGVYLSIDGKNVTNGITIGGRSEWYTGVHYIISPFVGLKYPQIERDYPAMLGLWDLLFPNVAGWTYVGAQKGQVFWGFLRLGV